MCFRPDNDCRSGTSHFLLQITDVGTNTSHRSEGRACVHSCCVFLCLSTRVCVCTRVLEAWSAPLPPHPFFYKTTRWMCVPKQQQPSCSLILQRSVSTWGQERGDDTGCVNHVEFEKNTDKVVAFAQEHTELSAEHYRQISALQPVCFYSVIWNGNNGKGLKKYIIIFITVVMIQVP